jgi:hypothetical protein
VAEFSAADAAFTGFRIVWERPWAVAIWAGLQFVFNLALRLFMVASAGPALMKLSTLGTQASAADPNVVLGLFRQIAPTYVVLLIAALVLSAVLYAAMNRAVMRPQESQFGYLRLAADELRQLGLLIGFTLLFMGVELAFLVIGLLLLAILGTALGGSGVAVALAILLPVAICGFVYVGVRFSLATPMTFATGRINLFGSWTMTRGRFWPLLGTYVLALALSLVVGALTFVIAALIVGIIGGGFGGIAAMMQADISSVASVLTPAQLVYLAITSIGAALGAPITMCPPAAIYRSLTGGGPGAVGKVFD